MKILPQASSRMGLILISQDETTLQDILRGSLPYIAHSLTSHPSTYMSQRIPQDTYPIRTFWRWQRQLLAVKLLFRGYFLIMQLVRLVQSIEYRSERCLFQETFSHHPFRSCTLSLLSLPLISIFWLNNKGSWLFNQRKML